MLRTLASVAAGVVIGLVAAFVMRPSEMALDGPEPGTPIAAKSDASDATAAEERELAALTGRIAGLESSVADLARQLESLQSKAAVAAAPAAPQTSPARGSMPSLPSDFSELAGRGGAVAFFSSGATPATNAGKEIDQLVAGGFSRQRAEWIRQRNDELAMQQMQARYQADRDGKPLSQDQLAALSPEIALRKDLGDTEYEQYLEALGRPTKVSVFQVIGGSPADTAGIQTGDRLVSYAGRRIFDMTELNPMILDGTPGESVVVEVERDGQPLSLVVPRGPLGVAGGSTMTNGHGVASVRVLLP